MKQAMWIVSVIPFLITALVLQFMPDSVPMHYNLAGEIDRWGSKYENLIFPIIILALTLFWQLLISYFERKAKSASPDKERAEAASNATVLKVVAISMAAMFGIMQCVILYSAYIEADTGASRAFVDIGKVSCILLGIVFVVLGNFLPKTKRNQLAGVRVSWSMYNDTTWRKSNRFGSIALIAAGFLAIITAIFASAAVATILTLAYLTAATAITLIYARRIYKEEIAKENIT